MMEYPHLSYNEMDLVESLIVAKREIDHGEWLYSKNENRLCRLFDNPDARAELRAIHDALVKLMDGV